MAGTNDPLRGVIESLVAPLFYWGTCTKDGSAPRFDPERGRELEDVATQAYDLLLHACPNDMGQIWCTAEARGWLEGPEPPKDHFQEVAREFISRLGWVSALRGGQAALRKERALDDFLRDEVWKKLTYPSAAPQLRFGSLLVFCYWDVVRKRFERIEEAAKHLARYLALLEPKATAFLEGTMAQERIVVVSERPWSVGVSPVHERYHGFPLLRREPVCEVIRILVDEFKGEQIAAVSSEWTAQGVVLWVYYCSQDAKAASQIPEKYHDFGVLKQVSGRLV